MPDDLLARALNIAASVRIYPPIAGPKGTSRPLCDHCGIRFPKILNVDAERYGVQPRRGLCAVGCNALLGGRTTYVIFSTARSA